jgi:hypothetical protein
MTIEVGDTVVCEEENKYWDGTTGVVVSTPADQHEEACQGQNGCNRYVFVYITYLNLNNPHQASYGPGRCVGFYAKQLRITKKRELPIPEPSEPPVPSLRRFPLL